MAVLIETKPAFKAGQPRLLFEGPYFESGHDIAVTQDGKGFILIRESDTQTGPMEMQVVVNWLEELNSGLTRGIDGVFPLKLRETLRGN
jgi:hypothetical protein